MLLKTIPITLLKVTILKIGNNIGIAKDDLQVIIII